jgi:L-lactate dehydrogenase complex protein LldG
MNSPNASSPHGTHGTHGTDSTHVTLSPRERIMRRLTSADSFRSPYGPPLQAPDVAAYYAAHQRNEDRATRIARFRSAIEAAHAEVHDTDAAGWPQLLCRIAAEKGAKTLLHGTVAADAAHLANIQTSLRLIPYERSIDTWRSEMFATIDAGFTRARSAIAETGSLVLWPGTNEPRLMSLVPPIHFVLLDADTIHADLHGAMLAEKWATSLPTNALLISGPSKTADIQQTLAYGAHGPRELIVLLCHPQATEAQP